MSRQKRSYSCIRISSNRYRKAFQAGLSLPLPGPPVGTPTACALRFTQIGEPILFY